MTLEDRTLLFSPGMKVSVRSVKTFWNKVLILRAESKDPSRETEGEVYTVERGVSDFLRGTIKPGDKILLIQYDGKVKAIYGPINEEHLYVQH
ncbi:MAG: hypothetical protein AABX50_02465 [Nanoarchaeota archaeon]